MVEINLGDVEKKMLDGVPKRIFVCILMLFVSTLTLFHLGVLDWTIEQLKLLDDYGFLIRVMTSIPMIFLFFIGYILPSVYFLLYLLGKEELDTR